MTLSPTQSYTTSPFLSFTFFTTSPSHSPSTSVSPSTSSSPSSGQLLGPTIYTTPLPSFPSPSSFPSLEYLPNYYNTPVGNAENNIITLNSYGDTLDIDEFCITNAQYIIKVFHFASQHIRLNCENFTASIYINHDARYNLLLAKSSDSLMNYNAVVSDIAFDISLAQGDFPVSVEFCLPVGREVKVEDACLAFWDDLKSPPEWRCEDRDLKKQKDRTLCGSTAHFTNFAILLAGTDASGPDSAVIAWLSLAFISVALIAVVVALLMIEMRMRIKKAEETKQWANIELKTETATQSYPK